MWVFRTIAESDLGLIREGNEDSGLVTARLLAVADGMGGHVGGEVASKIAIHSLAKLEPVLNEAKIDVDSREDLLLNITFEIDREIAFQSQLDPSLTGMGTTLTAIHLEKKSIELLHVGDSRCYRYRDGKLTQLSYDHTLMQELIDQGRLTHEEVFDHPQRSVLTQVLMGNSQLDPVLQIFPTEVGDHFLLCSDGLTSVLSDLEIVEIIRERSDSELLPALISATKSKGAPDNITILWAEVVVANKDSVSTVLIGAAHD